MTVKHRLFNLLSVLSLLLFVAMLVVWVRSHLGMDFIRYQWTTGNEKPGVSMVSVTLQTGLVHLVYGYGAMPEDPARPPTGFTYDYIAYEQTDFRFQSMDMQGHTLTDRIGFAYGQFFRTGYGGAELWLPQWAFALGAAILPVRWLWLHRRHHHARGRCQCPKCGYDLRASKDRCPECGRATPAQSEGVRN